MSETIISCSRLTKTFQSGNGSLTVLRDISLSIERSQTCAIVGPSGSGKSTLLALLAGLDRPSSGEIQLVSSDLNALSEEQIAVLRSKYVGFIFQNFQLLPGLTALENVMLPLEIQGNFAAEAIAKDLLAKVGLQDRLKHYPFQLSGGEQQRVALARAFIHKPLILFADEPTGNLDPENAEIALNYLLELNRSSETAIVMVTHDTEVAARMGRSIRLERGSIVNES